jgi:hypothetical protein
VIRTADGSRIEATPEHPFWVEGKGFVVAKRLARSDLLADHEGRTYAVETVSERKGRFTVYNLEVEATHTYYAGEAGWWIHNDCSDIAFSSLMPSVAGATSTGSSRQAGRTVHRVGTGVSMTST